MKLAVTYMTRRCPRDCAYCSIRDGKDTGPELTVEQWIEAFDILKSIGVTFNLILGNEPWLLGEKLVPIFKANKVPYAMYTTAPKKLFSKNEQILLGDKVIDNLSCGVDYPMGARSQVRDASIEKAADAWDAFYRVKKLHPEVDMQGTITVHRRNIAYIGLIVQQLSKLGIFAGINLIHWSKDHQYDFFPPEEDMKDYLFKEQDYIVVTSVFKSLLEESNLLIYNPEYLQAIVDNPKLIGMGWHCQGNPYDGPTIDADGTLRVCGYRKGTRTPKFTIFDLPEKTEEWKEAVRLDAMDCPGCIWVCPFIHHYWKEKDPAMGEKVFTSHAGEHIDKSKWSKRRVE